MASTDTKPAAIDRTAETLAANLLRISGVRADEATRIAHRRLARPPSATAGRPRGPQQGEKSRSPFVVSQSGADLDRAALRTSSPPADSPVPAGSCLLAVDTNASERTGRTFSAVDAVSGAARRVGWRRFHGNGCGGGESCAAGVGGRAASNGLSRSAGGSTIRWALAQPATS